MKTQITQLENQVLKAIQRFTSEEFSSDTGNWSYVSEIAKTVNPKSLRGLITTLQSKGILQLIDDYNSYVEISDNYYKETGKETSAGSPEIEFINLEVK